MTDFVAYRYEIANGDKSWQDAERQIRDATAASNNRAGRSTVVSVKSSKPTSKRKVDELLDVDKGQKKGEAREERKMKKEKREKKSGKKERKPRSAR